MSPPDRGHAFDVPLAPSCARSRKQAGQPPVPLKSVLSSVASLVTNNARECWLSRRAHCRSGGGAFVAALLLRSLRDRAGDVKAALLCAIARLRDDAARALQRAWKRRAARALAAQHVWSAVASQRVEANACSAEPPQASACRRPECIRQDYLAEGWAKDLYDEFLTGFGQAAPSKAVRKSSSPHRCSAGILTQQQLPASEQRNPAVRLSSFPAKGAPLESSVQLQECSMILLVPAASRTVPQAQPPTQPHALPDRSSMVPPRLLSQSFDDRDLGVPSATAAHTPRAKSMPVRPNSSVCALPAITPISTRRDELVVNEPGAEAHSVAMRPPRCPRSGASERPLNNQSGQTSARQRPRDRSSEALKRMAERHTIAQQNCV